MPFCRKLQHTEDASSEPAGILSMAGATTSLTSLCVTDNNENGIFFTNNPLKDGISVMLSVIVKDNAFIIIALPKV